MIHDSVDTQERQLTRAAADLAAEFPEVPQEVIAGLVRLAAERYEAATVRTFLPILVTKDVRAQLRSEALGSHLPAQPAPAPVAPPTAPLLTRQTA